MNRQQHIFIILTIGFVVMFLVTNIVTVKYCAVACIAVTAGAFTYPFTFLLLDLITELYGKAYAQQAVWLGFGANILMLCCVQGVVWLPVHIHSPVNQKNFQQFFGFMPGLVLSSLVAYLLAQFLDIYLFHKVKRYTGKRLLWLRSHISTLLSQVVDTFVFGFFAWIFFPWLGLGGNAIQTSIWWTITGYELFFKMIFMWISTPMLYGSVFLIKKIGKME